jgi:hypothetical protein
VHPGDGFGGGFRWLGAFQRTRQRRPAAKAPLLAQYPDELVCSVARLAHLRPPLLEYWSVTVVAPVAGRTRPQNDTP